MNALEKLLADIQGQLSNDKQDHRIVKWSEMTAVLRECGYQGGDWRDGVEHKAKEVGLIVHWHSRPGTDKEAVFWLKGAPRHYTAQARLDLRAEIRMPGHEYITSLDNARLLHRYLGQVISQLEEESVAGMRRFGSGIGEISTGFVAAEDILMAYYKVVELNTRPDSIPPCDWTEFQEGQAELTIMAAGGAGPTTMKVGQWGMWLRERHPGYFDALPEGFKKIG